eukprot:SAG22_NODE_17_length_32684_cov_34.234095_23_plen_206_part_00
MATVLCESSGTARKGRETEGKAVITAFNREDRCLTAPRLALRADARLVQQVAAVVQAGLDVHLLLPKLVRHHHLLRLGVVAVPVLHLRWQVQWGLLCHRGFPAAADRHPSGPLRGRPCGGGTARNGAALARKTVEAQQKDSALLLTTAAAAAAWRAGPGLEQPRVGLLVKEDQLVDAGDPDLQMWHGTQQRVCSAAVSNLWSRSQ